jgi:ATP adenylyltransferase
MDKIFSPWRTEYIEGFADNKEKTGKTFIQEAIESNDDNKVLVVERRDNCIVLMNKFPYNNGHLLITPKREVADIDELTEDEYYDLNLALRDSIKIIKKIYKPHGYNVGVNVGRAGGAGLPQHLHYHIVPRWNGDTNFMSSIADLKVISVSMQRTWEQFSDAFKDLKNDGKA